MATSEQIQQAIQKLGLNIPKVSNDWNYSLARYIETMPPEGNLYPVIQIYQEIDNTLSTNHGHKRKTNNSKK